MKFRMLDTIFACIMLTLSMGCGPITEVGKAKKALEDESRARYKLICSEIYDDDAFTTKFKNIKANYSEGKDVLFFVDTKEYQIRIISKTKPASLARLNAALMVKGKEPYTAKCEKPKPKKKKKAEPKKEEPKEIDNDDEIDLDGEL